MESNWKELWETILDWKELWKELWETIGSNSENQLDENLGSNWKELWEAFVENNWTGRNWGKQLEGSVRSN